MDRTSRIFKTSVLYFSAFMQCQFPKVNLRIGTRNGRTVLLFPASDDLYEVLALHVKGHLIN